MAVSGGGRGKPGQQWTFNCELISVILLVISLHLVSAINLVVNKDNLKSHFTQFNQTRNHLEPEVKESARQYIRDFVDDLQNRTEQLIIFEEQVFDAPDVKYDNGSLVQGMNLIYILPGSKNGTAEDKPVLLGAHYDTLPDVPGVDDNGSGVSAMLEILRLVAEAGQTPGGATLEYTMIFVAFDMQEYKQVGSQAFIDDYLIPEILEANGIEPEDFQGAFILETIMNFDSAEDSQEIPMKEQFPLVFNALYQEVTANKLRGDFLLVASRLDDKMMASHFLGIWEDTTSKTKTTDFKAHNLPIPLSGRPSAIFGFIGNILEQTFLGDNINFWEYIGNYTDQGLKAMLLTDTTKFRSVMKQCHHKPCDDQDLLTESNLEFLTTTTRVMAQVMLDRAAGKSLTYTFMDEGEEEEEEEEEEKNDNSKEEDDKSKENETEKDGFGFNDDEESTKDKSKGKSSDAPGMKCNMLFLPLISITLYISIP